MPSLTSWLSDLSRNKLHVAALGRDGWRDTLNLRRFVLLKNSITLAQDPSPSPHATSHTEDATSNTFIFPNNVTATEPSQPQHTTNVLESEEAWLESVLETLEESDDQTEGKVDITADEEFDFDDPFESWISPFDEFSEDPLPFPFSFDNFLTPPSVLPPLHALLINSPNSAFNQPFVEPRYPEADYDLPDSDGSSEFESDDDDGPLTPYSGSEPSLGERPAVEPVVYVEADSYFLYPSELDLISSPPFFQQC